MEPTIPKPRRDTVDEYLELERTAAEKHEFRDADTVAMAVGSVAHSLIIANLIGELRNRLKGSPCRVFSSDLRVRIKRKGLYSYPDITILCNPPAIDQDDPAGETVTNPRLCVEVLSPSTETYNRTKKFDRFRELESFEEYVLVSQDVPRVETYFRHADGSWRLDFAVDLQSSIRLRSVAVELPLPEIYSGVEFPPEAEDPDPLERPK